MLKTLNKNDKIDNIEILSAEKIGKKLRDIRKNGINLKSIRIGTGVSLSTLYTLMQHPGVYKYQDKTLIRLSEFLKDY